MLIWTYENVFSIHHQQSCSIPWKNCSLWSHHPPYMSFSLIVLQKKSRHHHSLQPCLTVRITSSKLISDSSSVLENTCHIFSFINKSIQTITTMISSIAIFIYSCAYCPTLNMQAPRNRGWRFFTWLFSTHTLNHFLNAPLKASYGWIHLCFMNDPGGPARPVNAAITQIWPMKGATEKEDGSSKEATANDGTLFEQLKLLSQKNHWQRLNWSPILAHSRMSLIKLWQKK